MTDALARASRQPARVDALQAARPRLLPRNARVTFVTGYFHPDRSASGQLLTELAVDLRRSGYEVTVYTAWPIYGMHEDVPANEFYQGVEIRRVATTRLNKNRPLGRVLNAATYFVAVFWTLLWRRGREPLIICSNPPFVAVLGYLMRVLRRQPYVYILHDVFPELAVTLGYIRPDGLVRRIWDQVNRRIVGGASRIVALGDAMRDWVVSKGGAGTAERVHVIHNWADESFIRPIPKSQNRFARQHGLVTPFVVLYSGNLGLSHCLESVIESAAMLEDRNVVFLFIGDGGKRKKLEAAVAARGLRNVRFLPYQPRELLPLSLTCSDVSLVALERGIEGLSMPSKLYAIMASGRPVVGMLETGGEVARIVSAAECGRCVEPCDAAGLAAILEAYRSNPGRCALEGSKGRSYFERHFSRARACREYLDLLDSLRPPAERASVS